MTETLLGSSSVQNQRAWELLSRIVMRHEDRFTGARTFGIPLFAEATNFHNQPVCNLLVTASLDGTAVAALSFALTTKGRLTLPPQGSKVEWLASGYRGTSVVLQSGSETVSRTFRVGTDVIPGPLFLFVSTPIAISKSSGSALIHLPTELLEVMARSGSVEFRFGEGEYRLSGYTHANQGRPHELGTYVKGLAACATDRAAGPEAAPLLAIAEEMDRIERGKQMQGQVIVGAAIVLVIALFLYWGMSASQPSTSPSIQPTPTPTATPATPARGRRRAK